MLYVEWLDTFAFSPYIDCPVYNVLIKHGLYKVSNGIMLCEYESYHDSLIWESYDDILDDLNIIYGGYKSSVPLTDTHGFFLERRR